MGLGADKVTSVQKSDKPTAVNDDLKIVKGAYVQIIAGKQSGAYGQVKYLFINCSILFIIIRSHFLSKYILKLILFLFKFT